MAHGGASIVFTAFPRVDYMFQNLKIGVRLAIGFGLLVCLLIAFLIIPIDIIRKAITSKKK